jgi:hypothetical protein
MKKMKKKMKGTRKNRKGRTLKERNQGVRRGRDERKRTREHKHWRGRED